METSTIVFVVLLGVLLLAALVSALKGFFTVEQQTIAIIERFGKFKEVAQAGLNFKTPWVDRVAHRVNLRVQQLDVKVETKTQDNVFVHLVVSVQHYILPEKAKDAYYKLEDPDTQITAYVFDSVRAQVPKMTLDDLFAKKDEIADAVKLELTKAMDDYGYGIQKALVTDINPDEKVKASMNAINAAQRARVAAEEQGEADRILKVKAALADKQTKILQGEGIAGQRKAIIDGLRESVEHFRESVPGATSHDVMQLALTTQYFDAMVHIGASSKNTTIFIPHGPGAVTDLASSIRSGMLEANAATGAVHDGHETKKQTT